MPSCGSRKACHHIASHSQPVETQGIRPTLDELKKDDRIAVCLMARVPTRT